MLLDTNIVIALLAGEEAVVQQLAATEAVLIPAIVLGELFYGAQKSGRRSQNLARVEQLAASSAILSVGGGTARLYGQIKETLRAAGRPLPENDIWIAALAREHDLPLVTRDHHFDHIPELTILAW